MIYREFQVLWVSKALKGCQVPLALRDLQDQRDRKEMKGKQDPLDPKATL